MTGLYLFAAAAGVPLVVWFLFAGDDDDGGLPLSTLAFAGAAFGLCGLALTAAGTGTAPTLVLAAVAGLVAGVLKRTVLGYLRRSESTTEVKDADLTGKIGRVVVPLSGDRRGKITVTVGDQQIHLSAQAVPGAPAELAVGAPVLVVEMRRGIASVTRLDPELRDGP
jgi:membrane protein implicated in regulation of membrane protease activity